MHRKIRILVVDDTALYRKIITEALSRIPDVEVIGFAHNGRKALEMIKLHKPDMITLDIEMPEMGGLEVMAELKKQMLDVGVIVVSSFTKAGSALTIKALELGAFDFITKPTGMGPQESLNCLVKALGPIISSYRRKWEIRKILKTKPSPLPSTPVSMPESTPLEVFDKPATTLVKQPLVAIGISTGGPNALSQVIPALPKDLPSPVLIVQHMPPIFTQSLANSLNEKSSLRVKEAEDQEELQQGFVYIAPGGKQMKISPKDNSKYVIIITDDPPENNCKPSVDYLFRSIANYYTGRVIAVIMTGMGNDGVMGLRLLKRKGARVIAQDEATSVVFGMPGEAIKAGVVDLVIPLDRIAMEIVKSVRGILL
ncbi:MAG: chemotaxis response regulator protein-glutamate methylesterase [Syntrophobacterales bacterium]|nr:chemotaxis response regulator protein-glutamate methylesterase [Syntrophobacterales bacterium]